MKVLIAGGAGFMGRHLTGLLAAHSHQVWVLSRRAGLELPGAQPVHWDGCSAEGWGEIVNEMDAVINLTGLAMYHWPWTKRKKQRFHDSRVEPGRALVTAIENATRRPGVFVQISGINYYGLRGEMADEYTPVAGDYLAQLAAAGEEATKPVEGLGVRHVVCRSAVVLAKDALLAWLMALPVRIFFGGPLGSGKQAMPWIHIADHAGAIRFLLENSDTEGAYNLIAPDPVTNAEFMRAEAKVLKRPFWFRVPGFLLRLVLGEMSVMVTEGRPARPKRLLDAGYKFQFPRLEEALADIFRK